MKNHYAYPGRYVILPPDETGKMLIKIVPGVPGNVSTMQHSIQQNMIDVGAKQYPWPKPKCGYLKIPIAFARMINIFWKAPNAKMGKYYGIRPIIMTPIEEGEIIPRHIRKEIEEAEAISAKMKEDFNEKTK